MSKFLNDFSIKTKLYALVLISAIALILVGGVNSYFLSQSNSNLSKVYSDCLLPVKTINQICTKAVNGNLLIMQMMADSDVNKTKKLKEQLAIVSKDSVDLYNELSTYNLDPDGEKIFEDLKKIKAVYHDKRQPVLDLISQERDKEAYEIYVRDVEPIFQEYLRIANKLSDHYTEASIKIDKDSAKANKDSMIFTSVFVISIIIFMIFIGKIISANIIKPLQYMIKVCEEFAKGDFRDKERKMIRKDEIGKLADSLVEMRTSLRAAFKSISSSSEQVAASSEELTATTEQTAIVITQVAQSIGNIAEGSQKQMDAVRQTNKLIDNISNNIETAVGNSDNAIQASEQTAIASDHGNVSVNKVISQMNSLTMAVQRAEETVNVLGQRSKEIGGILDTISDIASQTNLLALNAAIEAARAGEQGRGFSVVAEEVRKLAEQSSVATKKISDIVNAIQEDTGKALDAMSDSNREVKISAESISEAGEAFKKISDLISNINIRIKDVSESIIAISRNRDDIVKSVSVVTDQSNKAADESQTVSAATEEQSASMEEIAASSQNLAVLAQNMNTAITKFQI